MNFDKKRPKPTSSRMSAGNQEAVIVCLFIYPPQFIYSFNSFHFEIYTCLMSVTRLSFTVQLFFKCLKKDRNLFLQTKKCQLYPQHL